MIRALVFDCFGLFYPDAIWDYERDPTSPRHIATQLDELDSQTSLGLLSKHEFLEKSSKLLNFSYQEIDKQFLQSKKRNNELIKFAQELRRSYKIGLLSNIGADMMDGFFKKSELSELFDAVLLSGELKIAKPSPEIFKKACQQLGVKPQEAVMIDDYDKYCEGAVKIGMSAICYKNNSQLKAALRTKLKL